MSGVYEYFVPTKYKAKDWPIAALAQRCLGGQKSSRHRTRRELFWHEPPTDLRPGPTGSQRRASVAPRHHGGGLVHAKQRLRLVQDLSQLDAVAVDLEIIAGTALTDDVAAFQDIAQIADIASMPSETPCR